MGAFILGFSSLMLNHFILPKVFKTKVGFETQGLLMHAAMAFSEKGLPLGLIEQRVWPREHKKESFKWFHALKKVLKRTEKNQVVMVCDREADIYEFLEDCLSQGVDFVVRLKSNRLLNEEDFGDISLLNKLEQDGYTTNVYELYKKSLAQLALLQVKGHEGLNYNKCLTNTSFGKQAIMADLLYFKYYFLDALRRPYDKQKLIDDFEALSNYLSHTEYKYFMFRDFQSRNIMIREF